MTTQTKEKNVFVQTKINLREILQDNGKSKRYITDHLAKYQYMIHRINELNVFNPSDEGWSYISSAILDELFYNYRKEVIDNLIAWGVIESDGHYIVGEKSIGYRIAAAYQSKVIGEMILNEKFAANLQRKQTAATKITASGILVKNLKMMAISPACGQYIDTKLSNSLRLLHALTEKYGNTTDLYYHYNEYLITSPDRACFYKLMREEKYSKNLYKLEITDVYEYLASYVTAKFNTDELAAHYLQTKDYRASANGASGRLDTNLTNLSKCMRNFLQHRTRSGEPLVNVDLRNSQPFLFAIILREHYRHRALPKDAQHYIELVSAGTFYEEMMSQFDIPATERDAFKQRMFGAVFYCTTHYSKRTAEGHMFEKMFPSVYALINELKAPSEGMTPEEAKESYKRLPLMMQTVEAELILDKISKRLQTLNIYHNSIHDSYIVFEKDAYMVEQVIVDTLEMEYQLTPTVSVDELKPLQIERVAITL